MVIARKIAYNVVVSSVSKILSTILALVAIGFITRYLGASGFGNYATVLAFLAFFSAIADLGLNMASTREISRPGADESRIMGNIFAFRLAASLLVLFLSPFIVWFFPYPIEVKEAIIIVAASFLFSSSYQVLNGVFQKNLAMDKVAFAEFIGKVVQVAVIILAIKLNLGFLWIMSSLLLSMVVNFVLVYLWSRKYISFKLKFDFKYWKNFFYQSYPIGIAAFITFIYFKIDTIMLSVMKSSAEVGLYNAAYKVIENISFFPSMIVGLIFPIMSQNIFSNRERFVDISNKTYKVFWILVIPLVVGTIFLSDGIIALIGGSGFEGASAALRILIFALAFIFFGNFLNAILIAGNKQKKLMLIASAAAIFNFSANLFFISRYSYMGAAIISLATEILVVAGACYFIFKEIKYFPSEKNLWKIIVAGITMSIFLFFFQKASFFVAGFLSLAVYLVALWVLRAVKTEEIASIISKKGIEEYEEIP